MKRLVTMFGSIVLGLLAAPALAAACPSDSVKVGPVCVDKYEASVWQIYNAELRKQAQQGTLTLANLSRPKFLASRHRGSCHDLSISIEGFQGPSNAQGKAG